MLAPARGMCKLCGAASSSLYLERPCSTLPQLSAHVQSIFCHVPPEHVLNIADVPNIWWVPVMLREQRAHETISTVLGLPNANQLDISAWETRLAARADILNKMDKTNIAVCGKYTGEEGRGSLQRNLTTGRLVLA